MEHKLRNEICARRQSSKLSDWRPLEFFFGGHTKKRKKNIFFIKRSFLKICSKKPISRLGPCESWRPELSENVGLIGRVTFLTGVIGHQRWMSRKKTDPSPKISGVKKKRHGHNFEFWGLKRIARPANHVWRPCYSFQTPKIDIVAVSFFFNAASPENFFFKFHPTLTANNSGLKPSKL